MRTPTRKNIGKPGTIGRRILLKEVTRPGLSGFWNYHATKGWRQVRGTPAYMLS